MIPGISELKSSVKHILCHCEADLNQRLHKDKCGCEWKKDK